MDFYVIFLVYCIQFFYKQACGGFAFKQAEHTATVQAVNI